jgi:hypothetical protein
VIIGLITDIFCFYLCNYYSIFKVLIFTPLTAEFLDDMIENIEYLDAKTVTNAMLATTTGELGGGWSTYTPTLTGFSGTPTISYAKYKQIGKTVSVAMGCIGTSNSTQKFVSLPVPAASWQDTTQLGLIVSGDGSSNYAGTSVYRSATSNVQIYHGMAGASGNPFTAWASSGTASFNVGITYEAA